MDGLNRDMQKRVWDRVQGKQAEQMPPLRRENWKSQLYPVQENGMVYQSLAAQLGGREGEKLRRLHQESRKCVACIKGLCRLRGEQVKAPVVQPGKEPPRRALEKCYHREKKLWQDWEEQSADPEHGVVFGRLAQQAREHCVTILEILGEMEK